MPKRRTNIILLFTSLLSAPFWVAAQEQPGVEAGVDRRAELIAIIFRMAGSPEYNKGAVRDYVRDVDEYFGRLRDHPAVRYATALRTNRGIGYDAPMNLALYLDTAFALDGRIPFSDIDPRWTRDDALEFIKRIKDFSAEGNFDAFYRAHADLYRAIEAEAKDLIDSSFRSDWFEKFFRSQPRPKFKVVLCPLNGRYNYGAHRRIGGASEHYCFKGIEESIWTGYLTDDALGTFAHEFIHSYVNPLVDLHATELEESAKRIYSRVENSLKRHGYGHWKIMLYESITTAIDLHYRTDTGINSIQRSLRIARNERMGFFYLRDLFELIREYRNNPDLFPTFESFVPRLAIFLESCCGKMEN